MLYGPHANLICSQQFADEAACNKAMQAINDVPGKICLPPNTALPYQSTLNEHGSGYYYLFYRSFLLSVTMTMH